MLVTLLLVLPPIKIPYCVTLFSTNAVPVNPTIPLEAAFRELAFVDIYSLNPK